VIHELPGARAAEVTVTRLVDAPRSRVWRAWTTADELVRFFGPRGTSIPLDSVTMDVRPGGVFRLTIVDGAGTEVVSAGTYLDVVEPELLRWEWLAHGAIGTGVTTITLQEISGLTEVSFHMAGYLDEAALAGHGSGVESSLDLLADYLKEKP
jgi:uncharacterized protein YndB with AHSA1/START domain